jgi:transcriptional regulator with XRE-family HTH domain
MPAQSDSSRQRCQQEDGLASDVASWQRCGVFETIGERLKFARESAGIGVTALARAVGTSAATVSRWESGERATPEHSMLRKAAAQLGYRVDWLLYGEEPMKPDGTRAPTRKPKTLLDKKIDKIVAAHPGRWLPDSVAAVRAANPRQLSDLESVLDRVDKAIRDSRSKG